MPRPRTASAILELTGAFKKNPQRRQSRVGEPIPEGSIGIAPRILTPEVRKCWKQIVEQAPAGVLTSSDRTAVTICARLLASDADGTLRAMERTQLLRLLEGFGLTPRGRTYLHVAPAEGPNPFRDI